MMMSKIMKVMAMIRCSAAADDHRMNDDVMTMELMMGDTDGDDE